MINKITINLLIGLGFSIVAHAGGSNIDAKTTATMQATCSISTDSIGFGAVATPLMMQSAQSDMIVKCSNSTPYTVDLKYGGIYGTGSYSEYLIRYGISGSTYNNYLIYNNSGVHQGYIECGFSGSQRGQVWFSNQISANLYGYTNSGYQQDTKGACISNSTQSGTYPKGWLGAYNASGNQPVGAGTGYAYGIMNGLSKGDKLAYSIQVPGESTKVWNAGINSYKSIGNGDNQILPMIAKIVPDKSGSKYPAPDMYLDTVTAVISY